MKAVSLVRGEGEAMRSEGRGRHPVLLVDDELNLLESLRLTLRRGPYEVHLARSAQEALAVLAARPIEVIVSDERMPGMGGAEFLGVVHRQYPETVGLILTGHSSLKTTLRAINEGGAFRILTKPCDPQTLLRALQEALLAQQFTRESARRLAAGPRDRAAARLEDEWPGITQVRRGADGSVLLDPEDADDPGDEGP